MDRIEWIDREDGAAANDLSLFDLLAPPRLAHLAGGVRADAMGRRLAEFTRYRLASATQIAGTVDGQTVTIHTDGYRVGFRCTCDAKKHLGSCAHAVALAIVSTDARAHKADVELIESWLEHLDAPALRRVVLMQLFDADLRERLSADARRYHRRQRPTTLRKA